MQDNFYLNRKIFFRIQNGYDQGDIYRNNANENELYVYLNKTVENENK